MNKKIDEIHNSVMFHRFYLLLNQTSGYLQIYKFNADSCFVSN